MKAIELTSFFNTAWPIVAGLSLLFPIVLFLYGRNKKIADFSTAILSYLLSLYVGVAIAFYVYQISDVNGIQDNLPSLGLTGDFFGGMLNPILAFASFIALLYTIRIQSEELRMTREELKASVKAQQQSADNQAEQVQQQKFLEEFKAIREMFVVNLNKADQLISRRVPSNVSLKEHVYLALQHANDVRIHTESNTGTENVKLGVNHVASLIDSSVKTFDYRELKEEYYSAVLLAYREFISLEKVSARLGTGIDDGYLLGSYANLVAFHCCFTTFLDPVFNLEESESYRLNSAIHSFLESYHVDPKIKDLV